VLNYDNGLFCILIFHVLNIFSWIDFCFWVDRSFVWFYILCDFGWMGFSFCFGRIFVVFDVCILDVRWYGFLCVVLIFVFVC
jgi:hypothetical protein